MLHITNTLTGKKEQFVPKEPDKVSLYVCGVTPYADAHIGHGRCYVAFDLLYRTLASLGYQITYCRNFTDVDDKLINKAQERFGDRLRYGEIAQQFIARYHEDMDALGCVRPDYEPRVTGHVPQIIDFVKALIDKGVAYEVDGDVYFHIPSFSGYPRLSKHNLDDLRAGARVEVEEKKKDPLDFALWKSEPEGEFWQSPWGWGRPGWHIECSALAAECLGEHIDIHAGGMDLIFPHHDNEIAQSESRFGSPFSRYWLHNAFVRIDKEKMSKSLGNVHSLRDIFAQYDPMIVRFYLLNHYYRAPIDFSFDELDAVSKSYYRLCRQFESVVAHSADTTRSLRESETVSRMLEFLCDDLNSVGALGILFEQLSDVVSDEQEAPLVKAFMHHAFGLSLVPIVEKEQELTPEVVALIEERQQARAAKDWARADAIRDQLQAMGVELQDKK